MLKKNEIEKERNKKRKKVKRIEPEHLLMYGNEDKRK